MTAAAQAEDTRKLYTPPEVADIVGSKAATVRKWIRDGLITPTETTGKGTQTRHLFDDDAVDAVRMIHEEGGRAEAAKAAMEFLPESIIAALPKAAAHFRLKGEVMVVSEKGTIRVQPKQAMEETLSRMGPGPAVILR